MADTLTSRCQCGAIAARASGSPRSIVNCHCTDCRRATGSVFGTVLYFPISAVKITGETASYDTTSNRGTNVARHFCPVCGSQMFTRASAWPDLIGMRAGTIEETDRIKPQRNVFAASKIESTPLDLKLPEFSGMP